MFENEIVVKGDNYRFCKQRIYVNYVNIWCGQNNHGRSA